MRRLSMAVGDNQVEIEISIFERGCPSRPVPDTVTLQQRVRALEEEHN